MSKLIEPYYKALQKIPPSTPIGMFMGVDPSNDMKKCGVAVVRQDGSIFALFAGEPAVAFLDQFDKVLSSSGVLCAVERQEYRGPKSKVNPTQIMTLAIAAGILAEKASRQGCRVVCPSPSEWGAIDDKNIRHERLMAGLSPLNKARTVSALTNIAASYRPDALDALGLAFWMKRTWDSHNVIDLAIKRKERQKNGQRR